MRSPSLHARFRNVVLVIATAMAVVVSVVVYLTARSHYLETGEASTRASVAAVQQSLGVGLYAHDEVLLQELVAGLARHPSIARVGVLDARDKALVTASAAASPASAGGSASAAAAGDADPSFEALLRSPFAPDETVGRLQVWLDTERLAAEARRQAFIVVSTLIVLLGSAFGVFNALARRLLSAPMHRLADELALIQPGSDRRLVPAPGHEADELGTVTAAANRLLDLQQAALERERATREEIAALEARYRGIFDSTSAGIFILDERGRLLQANPALGRLLALPDPFDAATASDFATLAFVRPAQLAHLVGRAATSRQPETIDLELQRRDGRPLWAHCMVSISPDARTGETRIEGVLYDITQRKLQEHAAQHRAEHDTLTGLKSRAYIEASLGQQVSAARDDERAVTLMFIDLDGFKAVNDRWGHAAGDAVLIEAAQRLRHLFKRGCDVVGRLGGDELVVLIAGVEATDPSVALLAEKLIASFAARFVLPNGESAQVGASVGVASYPLHATRAKTLLHAADAAMYAVKQSGKGGFVIADVGMEWPETAPVPWLDAPAAAAASPSSFPAPATQQRDPLTGLMDRRQLVERLALEHVRVRDGADPVGVICLDLDHFKMINVAHGAKIGDQVLCETARRLVSALRRSDVIARTGSDEFVVVLPTDAGLIVEDPRRRAEQVAWKLLDSLAEPFNVGGCSLNIQASAGASLIGPATAEGFDALREAQLALRRSKSLGHDRLVFFEQDMMSGFHDRLALEEDLRAAIGTEQLFLHVQPQVDRAGTVTGGEALLRWQHPTRGLVPPDQFIPLAESCGAIVELGAWVLRAGCEILVELRRHGGRQTLSVNLSPVQFGHPAFVEHVREALKATGAPADGLILEITEGLLITDMAHVAERLRELVALGVRFSIDDFGTGFSSLAYLRQLPLHEIKIDRSFIVGLPEDVAGTGIVCSILSMGSHLGLHVVAEGVETAAQRDFLAMHGCPSQQGWLHGRPMAPAAFLASARQVPA